MQRKSIKALCLVACVSWLPAQTLALVVDPMDDNILINDGAVIDGTRTDDQSTFNDGITSQDLTGSFQFSDIPTAIINGVQSFIFLFDSQETGGSPGLNIDSITIEVGSDVIWSYDAGSFGSIMLAGDTDSPLGNGADIALAIPVALFAGLGLTGSDSLVFSWTQSNDNNGFDEWVLGGNGTFGVDDPITPVPLPAAAWLFLTSLLGGGFLVRRKKRRALAA